MKIKDENKDIDLELVGEIESQGRERNRCAARTIHRRMREEGIKRDERLSRFSVTPYRT